MICWKGKHCYQVGNLHFPESKRVGSTLQHGSPYANGAIVRAAEDATVSHEVQAAHIVCVCTQNLFRAAILQIPDSQSLVLRTAADAAIGQLHHPAGVRFVAI